MSISGADETFKRISPLIERQFPAFIREEGPRFVAFLKAYYEYLEQQGNAVQASRSLLEYQDIDRTIDSFVEYFRKEFMISIPKNTLADQRLLVKHIRDFYRTKGSEFSYKFLFRALFNQEIEIYYPGDYVLRASDGRWIRETLLRVGRPFSTTPSIFEGRTITGLSSGATAKVQGISQVNVLGLELYELIVENVIGTFQNGETVNDSLGNTATIESQFGSIVSVRIIDGGAYHTIGDTLTISSGAASAIGTVSSTSPVGAATMRISVAGTGYRTDGNTILTVIGGSGNGLVGRVVSLSNTSSFPLNSDLIGSVANVVLSTGSTFVSLGTNSASVSANLASANISSTLATSLLFSNVTIGSINAISISSVGRGYETSLPTITVRDEIIYEREIDGQYGRFRGGDAVIVAENAPGTITGISIKSSDASFDRFSTSTVVNTRGAETTPVAYTDVSDITRYTLRANTYNGVVIPDVSGVINLKGRYTDTKGFLSSTNKLQDNRFYQEYSYVIRVSQILKKYRDIIKNLVHPAGVALFGEYKSLATLPHPGHDLVRGSEDTVTRMQIFANNVGRLVANSFISVSVNDLNSSGVEFSTSGRKMYVVGTNNDQVWQYNLSTAFDLNTANYSGKNFLVANTANKTSSHGDNTPVDIRFKPDGSRMYIIGNTRQIIEQYDLSTAWDLSTAYISLDKFLIQNNDTLVAEDGSPLGDYNYTTSAFQASVIDSSVTGLAFKPDGTRMFVVGSTFDNVVECRLSTPWDIKTAEAYYNNILLENSDVLVMQNGFNLMDENSRFFAFGTEDATVNSVTFSNDGTRMFITGTTNDKVFSYKMNTAWDITTLSYTSQFDTTPGSSPTGIALSTDETRLFIIDSFLDRVTMHQLQARLLNEDRTSMLSENSEYIIQQ
jgi:sugar lactone lactonase YvrE